MSQHNNTHAPNEEHGTMLSYVIGFLFSIVLTLLAYFMVVNQTFTGNRLLIGILTLAVLQMFVQIFFFLHLGRGPKPLYNIVFFVGTAGLIVVVVVGSIFIMDNLHYNMSPSDTVKKLAQKEAIYQIGGEKTGACRGGTGKNHKVYIENDRVTPAITNATLCDTLTIINKDKNKRELTFGTHPEHSAYGGETEIELRKDYNKTITLNQAGNYMFHDHLDPTVSGYFIVVK